MSEINWNLLQPVDTGAVVAQGFATGQALVKQAQTQHALKAYLANPEDERAYNALAALNPQAAAAIQGQAAARRKEALALEEDARRKALGAQYAGGDTTGARQGAIAGGDFDLAKQFGELDETKQKQTADFWGKAGSVAFEIRRLPTPEAKVEYWKQARPLLEAQGAPTELLDKIDPLNVAQIDAAIATAQKVTDLYGQTKPQEFNVGPGEGRYERDPLTGKITTIIAPNAGGETFGAPAPVGGQPAGGGIEGKNNPGALRKPGSTEFQTFPTHAAGVDAQHKQLNRYLGRGINTVGSIIETYAPRESRGGDNTDEQVNNYIAYVAQHAGVDPTQPITPAQVPVVAKAMREFETGHKERLAGVADAAAIKAAAHRAIAAGADPQKVRERAAAQGVQL